MKFFATAPALMAACAFSSTVSAATTGAAPWGYKTNDATMASPAQWADHYPTCAGSRQSPIDIATTTGGSVAARSLAFSGECGSYNLTQSDETFKASVIGGSCMASANGASYSMAQLHLHAPSEHTLDGKPLDGELHLHAPSEHTLDGKPLDGEVHFVHSNADGSALMVVGVFLQVSGSKTDPWMTSLLNGMEAVTPTAPTTLNLGSYASLVNANANRLYNYPGSLTTPACDEIVDWWVAQKPVKMSSKDFARLQTQLKELPVTDNGNNARPVQPLNGRTIIRLR
ncbi:hypothetical protein PHYBOEH_007800 [Phytophthora boehmeriae]|uniref:Alpha-carbonic anhydrase domain-containing protein n=1 Tax=Phytophthora boehmeriae TaxID=109152 RepID=A0A8T1W5I7_9STRA|nr:hypothetical protein PHYBOEH_007800 [Phytophthora boehmeriae]